MQLYNTYILVYPLKVYTTTAAALRPLLQQQWLLAYLREESCATETQTHLVGLEVEVDPVVVLGVVVAQHAHGLLGDAAHLVHRRVVEPHVPWSSTVIVVVVARVVGLVSSQNNKEIRLK